MAAHYRSVSTSVRQLGVLMLDAGAVRCRQINLDEVGCTSVHVFGKFLPKIQRRIRLDR